MTGIIFLLSIFALVKMGDNARILGIISTPSYSHQVVFQPLWRELSLRGHQVTVMTTDPINDPSLTNLTEIDTSFSYNILTDRLLEIINNSENTLKVMDLTIKVFSNVFRKQVEHPKVQQLLHDPETKFDLLLVEFILLEPMAFSKKFNCPFIGIMSADAINSMLKVTGNPTHPILYPDPMLGDENNLSLLKRVNSVLYEYAILPYLMPSFLRTQQDSVKSYLGEGYDLQKIQSDVSLMFVNSDPIFYPIRPVNPLVIPIGGKLMRLPSKPLPKNIKDVLDKAQIGFIYFSLGSNVNSKDMSEDTMRVLLETFKELPFTIMWKYEVDTLPNKPENVVISKWFPQLEVLTHPNIKLFITHGGALSMEEAVSARVPLLGMPFFVDQPYNVKRMVNRGFGLELNYKTLEKEEFKATILELINNPSYRNQINKLADLAEDQQTSGLDRAVWWTEYVLRHNGTKHLRSPALDLPLYQYYLLDVFAVLTILLCILVYLCVLCIKTVVKTVKYIKSFRSKLKAS